MNLGYGQEDIIILNDPERLAKTAAEVFIQSANELSDSIITFNVSVSGGTTPRLMYRLLAEEPFVSAMPWEKLHLFWVDERWVPFYDKASNFGSTRLDMTDRVPLNQEQIHAMPVDMAPQVGAKKYEDELVKHFGLKQGEFPSFDGPVHSIHEPGYGEHCPERVSFSRYPQRVQ